MIESYSQCKCFRTTGHPGHEADHSNHGRITAAHVYDADGTASINDQF
ncbi:hypothetical protein [Crateriforma conspicua]|nr:hypothetical protein [Crateriforma conspicua]